jgi:hypothetical protein
LLVGTPQTIEDLELAGHMKEVFLDSDTKVEGIGGVPSEIESTSPRSRRGTG